MKKKSLFIVGHLLVMVPLMAFAGTECVTTEYPEYIEAVCIGDESTIYITVETPALSAIMTEKAEAPAPEQAEEPVTERAAATASNQAPAPLLMQLTLPATDKTSAAVPFAVKAPTADPNTDVAKERVTLRPPYRITRVEVEAKKLVRMRTIQQELQNQPVSE